MDVVLTIDGRKAIPVRALPFVAGRRRDRKSRLSPDEVASAAAQQEAFAASIPFSTYHIVEGVPQPVPLSQWGQYVVELKGLSAHLKKKYRSHDVGYAKWSNKSISKLPAAVFVWLDEFQAWFSCTRPLVVTRIPSPDEGGEIESYRDSDDLYLSPLVPQRLCQCIREGFEVQFNTPVRYESLTKALEGWFDKPKAALPAWQRHRVNNEFWPIPWDELSTEQRTLRAAEWDARHNPVTAQERDRARDLVCRLDDVRREILEWELLKPNSITEKAEQANRLRDLHEKEQQLDAEIKGSVPQQEGFGQDGLLQTALAPVSGNRLTPRHASTKRIAEAFPPPKNVKLENWEKSGGFLSNCPKWLKSARHFAGKRGESALWIPSQFALCMVLERHIGEGQATAIIRREFPDWLDAWEELTTLLPTGTKRR